VSLPQKAVRRNALNGVCTHTIGCCRHCQRILCTSAGPALSPLNPSPSSYFCSLHIILMQSAFPDRSTQASLMQCVTNACCVLMQVLQLLLNILSRTFEFQADAFAAYLGYGPQLRSALLRFVPFFVVNYLC
jgi:hypothetical protein